MTHALIHDFGKNWQDKTDFISSFHGGEDSFCDFLQYSLVEG